MRQLENSRMLDSGQAPVISHSTARQVTMAGHSSSDVANRLAAAKPVSWQGKGDIFQAPWVPILRGKWLVLDLWGRGQWTVPSSFVYGMHLLGLGS